MDRLIFKKITCPQKRWFQYSLRTLLVFVTLFALICSWFAVKMRQAERQRQMVDALRRVGVIIGYDYHSYGCDPSGIGPPYGTSPMPTWLCNAFGEDFFHHITMVQTSVLLKSETTHVDEMSFDRNQFQPFSDVVDADLEFLKELSTLQALSLEGSSITDVGLENLRGLKPIRYLYLQNTKISDAGLEILGSLPQLDILVISETDITDAGLEHLQKLSTLKYLKLSKTRVTQNGVKKLKKSLPSLTIERCVKGG